MRQRKSFHYGPDGALDSDEESDPEDFIQAAHPGEEEDGVVSKLTTLSAATDTNANANENDSIDITGSTNNANCRRFIFRHLEIFTAGKVWYVQCMTIAIFAFLTYSYNNINVGVDINTMTTPATSTNVQIAIMTVLTLVGASPFCSTHLITAAIGTFVGGQNIIGSHGLDTYTSGANEFHYTNYLWLLLLSAVVGLIWCFIITNPRLNILDGYAGRLGSTTFIGMNVTMLLFFGPLNVVDWNRYYYGLVHIVHVGEEDSATNKTTSLVLLSSNAWTWIEETELAIGYVLAVIWLGVVSGTTRIFHQRYVQHWHRINKEPTQTPPVPLNNVLIPVLWCLLSILIVNSTGYIHSPGLYNGFAVGAYIGMASLQKISTIAKFVTVSMVAACWGLTLTPFFIGFAGKSGFTSMCGHVTHVGIEILIERIQIILRLRRRQQQQQQQRQDEQSQVTTQQQTEPIESNSSQVQVQAQEQHSFHLHYSHKPSKKKEQIFVTKQQRRQQQRLQHQQHDSLHQHQHQHQQQDSVVQLHHRAWDTTSKKVTDGNNHSNGDDVWEHPKSQHKVDTVAHHRHNDEESSLSYEAKIDKIDVV